MVTKEKTEIMEECDEEETANHTYHIRSKQYTKLCYWCRMHGYVD